MANQRKRPGHSCLRSALALLESLRQENGKMPDYAENAMADIQCEKPTGAGLPLEGNSERHREEAV